MEDKYVIFKEDHHLKRLKPFSCGVYELLFKKDGMYKYKGRVGTSSLIAVRQLSCLYMI